MATIIPFRAVRPTRDKVGLVAARAYQSYTLEQRESRLRDNPYSFLHIVNPGYKYDKKLNGTAPYHLVRNRYLEFKEEAIFIQDDTPCYYIYQITDREQQVFNGIIAAASAEEYGQDIIKKHEDTIASREIILQEYLKTVGFNAEPVLLTYPNNQNIANIISRVQKHRAEFEFTTTYRDTHLLWKVEDEILIKNLQQEFQKMSSIYIADGHHRTASSYLLYKDLKKQNKEPLGTEPYNFFMGYLIPESDLRIHEFNRVVKDLNGLSKEEFLMALDKVYRIENRGQIPYKPTKIHHFSMYLDGDFYSLHLRTLASDFKTALEALDAQILYTTILDPILGIKDLRNDGRLDYINGKKDIISMKNSIDKGDYLVGFGMVPVSLEEMKTIADEGYKMPPKSTYIEPKLRSGITIYEF